MFAYVTSLKLSVIVVRFTLLLLFNVDFYLVEAISWQHKSFFL